MVQKIESSTSSRDYRALDIFFFVAGLGTFLSLLNFLTEALLQSPYPYNTPFLSSRDRFMDYFNVNHMMGNMSPYLEFRSNYPPLPLFIAKLFGSSYDLTIDSFQARHLRLGLIPLAVLFLFFVVGVGIQVLHWLKSSLSSEKILTLFLMCVSYPALFMIDRGNYLCLAFFSMAVFALSYERNRFLAVLSLAIAISMKIYLVPFLALFLWDRRYKDILLSCVLILVLNGACLIFFKGTPTENLSILTRSIMGYAAGGDYVGMALSYQNSIVAPLRYFKTFVWDFPDFLLTFFFTGSFVIASIFVIRFLTKVKDFNSRFLLLIICTVLFQPMSPDYNLIFLILPLISLIGENRRVQAAEVFLISLLMVFKGYKVLFYAGHQYYGTIQSILNPIILVFLLIWMISRTSLYSKFSTLDRNV